MCRVRFSCPGHNELAQEDAQEDHGIVGSYGNRPKKRRETGLKRGLGRKIALVGL
jgi:hypothetical protein